VSFVYHGVPRGFSGDVIYPLNRLAAVDPELYALQRAKYDGRESVLEFRIPGADVLFNDTVHCASLHPYHLYAARQAVGMPAPARPQPPSMMTGLAFEIPLERITVHTVVWYSGKTMWINGAPNEDVPMLPPLDEFEPFEPARYRPLDAATPAHLDYLRELKARGGPSLMFVHIPHVLVAGPIDVRGLRVVAWDEPPRPSARARRRTAAPPRPSSRRSTRLRGSPGAGSGT
jgi:hypothetical protein